MDKDEDQAKKDYAENGVDLPELKDDQKPEEKSEEQPAHPAAPEKKEDEPKGDEPETPKKDGDPLQKPKPEEQKTRRSIYDDLKDERTKRQSAETEATELKEKLAAYEKAKPGEDADKAEKDLRTLIEETGANTAVVEAIIAEARKGMTGLSPEMQRRLDDFEQWRQGNQELVEKQRFEDEFRSAVPAIKEHFPTVSDEEIEKVKTELDTLAHSKEWNDKSLDYILFKNREHLATFVSPKKKGMEGKDRKDVDLSQAEFDPNADLSKLTAEERERWFEQYSNAGKTDGLLEDSQGRKIIA